MPLLVAFAAVVGGVFFVIMCIVGLTVGADLFYPVMTALCGVGATIYWVYLYRMGDPLCGLGVGMAVGLTMFFLALMYELEYFQAIWKWLNE